MIPNIIPEVAQIYLQDAHYVRLAMKIEAKVVCNSTVKDQQTVKTNFHFVSEKSGVNLKFALIHHVVVQVDSKNHQCSAQMIGPEGSPRLFSIELDTSSNFIVGLDKAGTEQFILDHIELPEKFDFRVMDHALHSVLNHL